MKYEALNDATGSDLFKKSSYSLGFLCRAFSDITLQLKSLPNKGATEKVVCSVCLFVLHRPGLNIMGLGHK